VASQLLVAGRAEDTGVRLDESYQGTEVCQRNPAVKAAAEMATEKL